MYAIRSYYVPALNVLGFLNQSREFPDGKDLNRMFPGTQNGSLASLFAWNLMNKILPVADYIVDFHTGGANRFNSSQIRISKEHPDLLDLAQIFRPRFIVLAPDREKSFREAATKAGKKIRITSYNVCYTKLLRARIITTMPKLIPATANRTIRRESCCSESFSYNFV